MHAVLADVEEESGVQEESSVLGGHFDGRDQFGLANSRYHRPENQSGLAARGLLL